MDPWPLVAGALVVGLLVAAVAVRAREARLARIRAALDARTDGEAQVAASRLREAAERQRLELADERRDHELLVDLVDVGIVVLDRGLRVVAANTAAHAFVGRAPGTMLGRDALEAFLEPDVERVARDALEVGSAAGEVRLRGADGPVLALRARRSTAGGVWLVLDDVSELRRLQQIRAEFIDNLSHELRTPLTTISLLAETLAREAAAAEPAVPARMRDRIAKIEVETGHLVQMVTELLDLSRIEAGGTIARDDVIDLEELARGSVERLRLFAERQGVRLAVVADGPVTPVLGDEARLGQVLVNLLHNAVKFSPAGGDVTVAVRGEAGEAVVAVADEGVGVPRAAQGRIFERFYKVDRARVRGQAGGTGLGLAIARHIVEQHGGRIWVDSEEGRGSTFSFAIPYPEGT